MATLKDFATYDISWNLTPEHAVTMYLEWGNNDWHSEYPPVRSKSDESYYFVVDTWGPRPMIRLVHRNSENAQDIYTMPVPDMLCRLREGKPRPQGHQRSYRQYQALA